MTGRSWRRWLGRGLVVTGVLAAGSIALRRQLVEVRGPSMEPTLWPGDRLVTVPALTPWLRPGQIVVLENPDRPGHRVIKRVTSVISTPDGAQVEVRGDDADRSTDGRHWGPIPAHAIRRIVVTRWPELLSPLTRPDPGDPG